MSVLPEEEEGESTKRAGGNVRITNSDGSHFADGPSTEKPLGTPPRERTGPAMETSQEKDTNAPSKEDISKTMGKMTVDQLVITWSKVGIHINEVAGELFDKSRGTPIGDGTCIGFVNSVLDRISGVSTVEKDATSFGYLIFQTGLSVTKNVADIMPGDIIALQDAKLEGRDGIQAHHRGTDEGITAVGIIGEYKPWKSMVKVYQACQHRDQSAGNQVGTSLS